MNKVVNPNTNRLITVGGAVWRKLVKNGVISGNTNSSNKSKFDDLDDDGNEIFTKRKSKNIFDDDDYDDDTKFEIDEGSDSSESEDEDSDSEEEELNIREEKIKNSDNEDILDDDTKDIIIHVVDAACKVISKNLKKLGSVSFTKRKRLLKSLITKELM